MALFKSLLTISIGSCVFVSMISRPSYAIFAATPIIDDPTASYSPSGISFEMGLYRGTNSIAEASAAHDQMGRTLAKSIVPLCHNGNPSNGRCAEGGSGAIGLVTMGFSNSLQQTNTGPSHTPTELASDPCNSSSAVSNTFCNLVYDGQLNSQVTPNLIIADCDQPGQTIPQWDSSLSGTIWTNCESQVLSSNLTDNQVEAVVLEVADTNPQRVTKYHGVLSSMSSLIHSHCQPTDSGTSGVDACFAESHLGSVIRLVKTKFPNVKQMYLYSRAYAGYATTTLSPEPFAYEYWFTIQQTILAQIAQANNGDSIDPVAGDLSYKCAPWLSWADDQWASGSTPNDENITWLPGDFQGGDGIHYSRKGWPKSAEVLYEFFLGTSVIGLEHLNYTTWFRP